MARLLKQVIVVRRDLRLKKASIAALVAKASSKFIFDNDFSERGDVLQVDLTQQEAEWIAGPATRIVLGVTSESALKQLIFKAELEGLSCYTVTNSHQEDSDAVLDELLCVAIGPDDAEKIDQITGNLKLI